MTSLLQRRSHLDPLLRGEVLTELREDVLRQAKSVKQRTVLDRIQDNMVVWSSVQHQYIYDFNVTIRTRPHQSRDFIDETYRAKYRTPS